MQRTSAEARLALSLSLCLSPGGYNITPRRVPRFLSHGADARCVSPLFVLRTGTRDEGARFSARRFGDSAGYCM